MDDKDLAGLKKNDIASLVEAEKRYYVRKIILIVTSTLVIIGVMAYLANKSVDSVNEKNQRVEKLMRCSLPAFTPQNYSKADSIIKQCLEANR